MTIPRNHQSALSNPTAVDDKLATELAARRIEGPSKFRTIHDLSYPKGHSVNESIPPELATVAYHGLDHCVCLLYCLWAKGL